MSSSSAELDSLVSRFYSSISFTAGGAPNWTELASLFHESAIIVPPASDTNDRCMALFMPEFVVHFRPKFDSFAEGFAEYEIFEQTMTFGDAAQRASGYGIKYGATTVPMRGVNLFQFVRPPGGEWVIASLVWDRLAVS